jgi:TolB-like protein/predicted Zn-dependent protease
MAIIGNLTVGISGLKRNRQRTENRVSLVRFRPPGHHFSSSTWLAAGSFRLHSLVIATSKGDAMNEPEAPQQPSAPPTSTPESPAETQPFVPSIQGLWAGIKKHKVVQWTLAYLAIAYTLLHGAEMLAGTLNWSHGLLRIFTLILILGIPVIITLAWYHGTRGQQRVSGTEFMIIASLLALGGAFLWRDSSNYEQASETAAVSTSAPAVALPDVPVAPNDKSIAVLPFIDMSAEKNQEYMSDGIAEELLNLLAQAPDLKVIARTSSFAFKGQNLDIAEIARKLNVAYVLEGSVRTSGKQMRITAQLVRAADSTQLWSEKYDRPPDDIFAVQDAIANAIVQALQIKLMGGTLSRREGGTDNLEAYQFYLRAVNAQSQLTRVSLDAAEDYAERAIKLDPHFGRAWSRLALIERDMLIQGSLATSEGTRRVRQHAQRALELSPDIAEAHALLHQFYVVSYDWAAAQEEVQQALAIDPTDPEALAVAATLSATFGRYDDADQQIRAALNRDPLSPTLILLHADNLYRMGRFAEAEGILRSLVARQPASEWIRIHIAKLLLAQGKPEAALAMAQQEIDEGARLVYLPVFLQAAGRKAEADAALKAQIEYWAVECAACIARTYAYRGEHDFALEWLERAYQQKDTSLLNIVDEPLFGNLADDPRFKAFLRNRLKLPI